MTIEQELEQSGIKKFDNTDYVVEQIISIFLLKSVILLVTPTQFGKTTFIFWTIYEMVSCHDVPTDNVFIMTAMLSNDWKKQTKSRMLPCIQKNVWHNSDIRNLDNKAKLKKAVESNQPVLVVIDEVHIGSSTSNTIFTIFKWLSKLSTPQQVFNYLFQNKVKFLLVSATPDSFVDSVLTNSKDCSLVCAFSLLHPPSEYVWHKTFLDHNRISSTDSLLNETFFEEIIQRIKSYSQPLYHVVRPNSLEYRCVVKSFKNHFKVIEYNNKNWIHLTKTLEKKPKFHTIILLKEMLRVAQTMCIKNVGVLVDRCVKDCTSVNSSTVCQSLVGRASGHDKLKYINQIYIYSYVNASKKYVALWESNFNYEKVPGYIGYGIKVDDNGEITFTKKNYLKV